MARDFVFLLFFCFVATTLLSSFSFSSLHRMPILSVQSTNVLSIVYTISRPFFFDIIFYSYFILIPLSTVIYNN